MIGVFIWVLLVLLAYALGHTRGQRCASTVIDNPNPSPTADTYYHRVHVDGNVAFFTQEQVNTAIGRADRAGLNR